ncbi:hypothetical protein PR001_g9534 [Phytophthora rubi]|uniref:Uncharacterized protein n=1 Tax=Phytophthora rubi TaxID=129364 RepID=A0A6A3MPB5_9STRA|nr:hypothetical protein PR002_g9802 [Phytophthora rubi]KAE9034905.1 hypothetical protein PR001_g9534 [Phytophthora rubi]
MRSASSPLSAGATVGSGCWSPTRPSHQLLDRLLRFVDRCNIVLPDLLSFGSVSSNTEFFCVSFFSAGSARVLLIYEMFSSLNSAALVFIFATLNRVSPGCLAFGTGLVGCCKRCCAGTRSTGVLCLSSVALDACIRRLRELGSSPSVNGVTVVCWGC